MSVLLGVWSFVRGLGMCNCSVETAASSRDFKVGDRVWFEGGRTIEPGAIGRVSMVAGHEMLNAVGVVFAHEHWVRWVLPQYLKLLEAE